MPREAVAVCIECGAAVCREHAVVADRHLTRPAAMMRQIPVEPAARVVRCATCNRAVQAVAR